MAISSYRDLDAWKLGVDIAATVYELTRSWPGEERFGLTSQVRRSAVSIASNVAEGHGRESTADFVRCLRIAQGSLKEVETQLCIAVRVGLSDSSGIAGAADLCDRAGRVLRAPIRSLQTKERAREQ